MDLLQGLEAFFRGIPASPTASPATPRFPASLALPSSASLAAFTAFTDSTAITSSTSLTLSSTCEPAAPLAAGDRLLVAFSGGADSTALLWGLRQLASKWDVDLVAAHLDHAMDPGSAARAAQASRLARRLGVPLVSRRLELGEGVAGDLRPASGPEATARRARYAFLAEVRQASGARYIATAHHRDDQAETVLLRMRFGSGPRGLAGIWPVAGAVVRPLLSLPPAVLRQAIANTGLLPTEDPGNRDPRQPRSLMRHWVLPALAKAAEPDPGLTPPDYEWLAAALARLARRARLALPALDRRLAAALGQAASDAGTAETSLLLRLPAPLMPAALALLHRQAGLEYPPSRGAAEELRRQLGSGGTAGEDRGRRAIDCGDGWRWEERGAGMQLSRAQRWAAAAPFTYTLEVPGETVVEELGVRIRVSRRRFEDWMLRGEVDRAAFVLPASQPGTGVVLTVRNRRPGDRLRPLGSPGSRKLKELLIDRGVPAAERDRLPLVCWDGAIAWVPGITIDHRFRLRGEAWVFLAERTDRRNS